MSALGFTGTRATAARELELKLYLESADMITYLRKFDTYITGGCTGWDALVGRYLALKFPPPVAQHVVIVPANHDQIDPWWEEFDVGTIDLVHMPEGSDYRARNQAIVDRADQLFYCADYVEDDGHSKRSGTWMTVRMARAASLQVNGITLNKVEEP